MSLRIPFVEEEIIDQYLYDDNPRPWIIGFSGGKDSTMLLQLVNWIQKQKIVNNKKYLICFFLFLAQLGQAQNKKYADFETAKFEADKQGKDLLVVLTGSEWCKPCIKMKQNVFLRKEFMDVVENDLILYEVDLENPINLNSFVYAEYKYFNEKYHTNALPCLILFNKNGKMKGIISSHLTSFEKTFKKLKELMLVI